MRGAAEIQAPLFPESMLPGYKDCSQDSWQQFKAHLHLLCSLPPTFLLLGAAAKLRMLQESLAVQRAQEEQQHEREEREREEQERKENEERGRRQEALSEERERRRRGRPGKQRGKRRS
eukprot:1142957-Pelagomonas_calceolata.AAC.7